MILDRFKTGPDAEFRGQQMKFITLLFGKQYFWMEDVEGTTYLLPMDEDGLPDLS